MNKLFYFALLSILLACHSPKETKKESTQNPQDAIEIKTFQAKEGWGYDIYIGKKKHIHQPFVPCVAGTKGFSSEEKAYKVACLVAQKIQFNLMPSITPNELDSLKVLE